MVKIEYAFFVDFDGTIATPDVCETMVATFAGEGYQEINRKWEKKELSTLECAAQTFRLFKSVNQGDLLELLDRISVDPNFKIFLAYCREREFPVTILSDGYDFYIRHLLEREGLDLPYYANRLLFERELKVKTPYHSETCDSCGVCKSELMQLLKGRGQKNSLHWRWLFRLLSG